MKLGVQFFVTGYTVDPVTLAKAVEDAGFESFWAPEHATIPADPATPFPMSGGAIPAVYGQMADPFVLLSVMAGVTTRLKLGTAVCLVPDHHPLVLAKSVSSLDNFSGGRFLFGLGTGWLKEIRDVLNPLADKPWKYTEESVAVMKELWRHGVAGSDGDLIKFAPMICDPRPVQRPHPPVLVGAQATPTAARRIAAWGDGWIAMGSTPDQVRAMRQAIAAACEEIGRDPSEIEVSVGVRDPSPDVQAAYEDAGADRLIVLLYNHPATPIPMHEWAQAGLRGLEAAPPSAADTLRALDEVHRLARL